MNRWRTATWIGVAIAVALAVLPALNATYLQPRSPVPSAIGDRAELVVTGYSTAGNASLPDKLWGINNYLDRECTACAGKTGTLVESGQSFGWIRSNVCSDVLPDETTRVLFIGGDNDDLLQTQGRFEAAVMQLTLMVHFAMSDATDFQTWVDRWAGAFERNGARRLKDTAESAEIEMAMSCAREHHQTFYYFHDFLVTDLHGGRGANRQRLLERRRQVVEAGGGIFVDLLAVFGAGAGVSWFNDFIHPSAVGHQKIGKLMCQMLGPSQPPSVPMPEWTAPDQMPIGKMFGKVSLLHDGPAVATSEPRSAALRDRTKPRPETLVVYP